MKLKSIRINGFKSFADKIDLELKSNITAIVGPNGSGKSNLVDAVRWVLGEQSVKSLRGSKEMVDVIFSGSESRSGLKRAEVALEFDNSDHFLNTDLETVEVKRILYKTGENEYYINNAKVRLKDVTSLFLDSGIGNDSLNIISQGSIEKIVTAKPEERRVILESASKVLKYKNRKIESLRKLEKAKDNLEKVDLVINELEVNLEPLKKQSEEARTYLALLNEYEEIDRSLTTYDIKKYHEELEELERKRKTLENEKLNIESENTLDSSKLENYKTRSLEIEEEIEKLNEEYTNLTEKLANIESEKNLILERQKYAVDEKKVDEEYLLNKEKETNLEKEKSLVTFNLKEKEDNLNAINNELGSIDEKSLLLNNKKRNNDLVYQNKIREEVLLENKIEILKNNILEDNNMPVAVKNILHNPRLKGIKGTIGKLIEVKNDYSLAISVALASSTNFVVVENELNAKDAINYLKDNHLGRVTFFPMNVIKGRKVGEDIIKVAQKCLGFIGVASDLISYNSEFQNIIENQLGNVLITKDMNAMNELAKKLDYKYRIVSLDGEITHAGGSISGGTIKVNNSLNDKLELEKKETELKILQEEKNKLNKNNDSLAKELEELETKRLEVQNNHYVLTKEVNELKEKLANIEKDLLNTVQSLKRTDTLKNGGIEKEIEKLLASEKDIATQKELTNTKIRNLRKEKSDIASKLAEEELEYRKKNTELHTIINDLNELEIRKNKIDIKMDYLLNHLSEEYHITFDKAKVTYILDMDYDLAKENAKMLKAKLSNYKMVNLGSIDEFNRINERYEFLSSQKEDLVLAIEELENIIKEMDEKMVERLTKTFDLISKEFEVVFKDLFKGGRGMLKLTDPDNILETGIEIVAEPPGKKLDNIVLLSGGEKTLTAIALLFAILNVFPVPFCILDEVEAALDEANVDTFGKYLQEQKAKSEYILITHKKRTMEYADTLYGITMQEKGVSKIVSVKLED